MTATDVPIAGHPLPDNRTGSEGAELPALSIAGLSHCYGPRRALTSTLRLRLRVSRRYWD
jgi:hypothetical protein